MELNSLSKFLSLILRHKPEVIGLTLDNKGYLEVDELIKGIKSHGKYIDKDILDIIVSQDSKQRYSYNSDKTKIRANQGHSVKVDLGLLESTPPAILYHGTPSKFVESISKTGLNSGQREHVHLSSDVNTAIEVAKRRGNAVIYEVDTRAMIKDGYKFFLSENNVWLTDSVPSKYLIVKDA